ncbi:MAG: LLM class flavin-dependent oxidoreductase [Anaerolineae bacterium]|nr:LLM class flavin-dependent oxidoreductase [Anaerolineae bacterium]
MKFGITLPPFGDYADPRYFAETARVAESLGWDGLFIWDHVFFDPSFHPNLDVWVGLAAAASVSSTIRLGTLITPLARRRPWVLARQTVSLDRLSNGRLTLGVGLGDPAQWDFAFFNETTDPKIRAQMLDEGLALMTGLWTGEPFGYQGTHYQMQQVRFQPTPVQSPRIPIWVGGNFPNKPPMRRAARWDGFYPIKWDGGMTPQDWREVWSYISQQRPTDAPFDLVNGGRVPDDQWMHASSVIEPYAEVGVTWWIEDVSPWRFGHSWEIQWQPEFTRQMDDLIRRGPPRL